MESVVELNLMGDNKSGQIFINKRLQNAITIVSSGFNTYFIIRGGLCNTMKVTLLKKHTFGLVISILLIITNNELIKKGIENISNNKLINLSTLIIYCFNPIISLITLIGIALTYYFIVKIYIIIFAKEKN